MDKPNLGPQIHGALYTCHVQLRVQHLGSYGVVDYFDRKFATLDCLFDVFFGGGPLVTKEAPFGERNHGYATVRNIVKCLSVSQIRPQIPGRDINNYQAMPCGQAVTDRFLFRLGESLHCARTARYF